MQVTDKNISQVPILDSSPDDFWQNTEFSPLEEQLHASQIS